jgi:hypothetical protein
MPTFTPGITLSREFYISIVRPLLDIHFPQLPHAAGLLGTGSDVLGFDDTMSTDHNWGPTVLIFLTENSYHLNQEIDQILRRELPYEFCGYPVNVDESPDEPGTVIMKRISAGPVNHRVFITTVRRFIQHHLGFDIDQPLTSLDWLTIPSQILRSINSGAVHYDCVGELTRQRARFTYYPHGVWLYLLACGWKRIEQEEHLMPRAGLAGDELGSAIIASRLVRDIMNLCFLMEKVYAPYPKWYGSAFNQLKCGPKFILILWRVQQAKDWRQRETALCEAYQQLAAMHNQLGITEQLPEETSAFHDRPFQVIHGELFANAILERITDPEVKRISGIGLIGGIDQFSDSTDLRSDSSWRERILALYK